MKEAVGFLAIITDEKQTGHRTRFEYHDYYLQSLNSLGESDKAIAMCRTKMESAPDKETKRAFRKRLHYLLVRSGQFDEADKIYNLLNEDSDKDRFHQKMRYAESLYHRGKIKEALDLVLEATNKKSKVIGSPYFDLLAGLVTIESAERDLAKARPYLDAALKGLNKLDAGARATEGKGILKFLARLKTHLQNDAAEAGDWEQWSLLEAKLEK
ncbi:MAG: hypothetical protein AB8B55_15840 [Mariniblastus sp.]